MLNEEESLDNVRRAQWQAIISVVAWSVRLRKPLH